MTRRRGICAVVAVLVAAGWLLAAPGAAFAVKESQPLEEQPFSGPSTSCSGVNPKVGKVVIKTLKVGGVKVKVRIKNGTPNQTFLVAWQILDPPQCTTTGFATTLGQLTTDAFGQGRLAVVLPGGNPFPGKPVMIDLIDFNPALPNTVHDHYSAFFNSIFQ